MRLGCFSLLVALILMIVLPVAFANMLSAALLKLNLRPQTASVIVFGILAGSLINIPVKRIIRTEPVTVDPLAVFGLHGLWPEMRRVRQDTVIAVNVGGCVIPAALAVYEAWGLLSRGQAIGALSLAVIVNVLVSAPCWELPGELSSVSSAGRSAWRSVPARDLLPAARRTSANLGLGPIS